MSSSEAGSADRLSVSLDVSAVPDQPVGVGRFVFDLVRTLSARDDLALTVWSRRADGARWSAASSVRAEAPAPRPLRLSWEQLRLPGLLKSAGVDLHHSPHYTMPERARLPRVVTVHDLTFFDHPEWHERSKVPVFRRAITVAARKATALLCDSQYTAERLADRCSPRGRIFVVPLGVDGARFRPAPQGVDDGVDGADVAALGEVLGERRQHPYVLFLGTLEPRKSVPDLVAAFDRVAGADPDLLLVLAGQPGWGVDQVDRAVAAARHGDRVVRTGYVPEPAVPALLRRAAVVVYPAKVEGFGLPALEALACGAPLITTSGTVMSDLAGGAAVTVAAGSIDQLAGAIESVTSGDEPAEAALRRQLGLTVAARHTWEACAAAHVEAYRWARDHGNGSATAAGRTGGPGPIR